MIHIYNSDQKQEWDDFITKSKNGTFLFFRDYMEYHSNKYTDHSIMFYEADSLIAVMPANIKGDTLFSHGGLTFGGIVSDSRMKIPKMLEIFENLKKYLKSQGVTKVIYKAIPHIYHCIPTEEDLYALFIHNAKIVRRDVSSTIFLKQILPFRKDRKWRLKKVKKSGLEVKRDYDFDAFMAIVENNLQRTHNIKPTHTAQEIQLLGTRFPENIKLFAVYRDKTMIAGVIMYESKNVAHAQYIVASAEGKMLSALDLIMDFLINEHYSEKRYFDFGISTENKGLYLNIGLIENKESFGARAVIYDTYELNV